MQNSTDPMLKQYWVNAVSMQVNHSFAYIKLHWTEAIHSQMVLVAEQLVAMETEMAIEASSINVTCVLTATVCFYHFM